MSVDLKKEKANSILRDRIRQRVASINGDMAPIYSRDNTNLSSYEKWEYRNDELATSGLKDFYNKYKGDRCFIIGNGPSLNNHDLSLLEGEKTFAVNSFYYKTRENGFKPTFFVVEDEMVMKENYEQFISYDVPFKFFPVEYSKYHPPAPNVFYFRMNHGFYQDGSPYYNLPRFSSDPLKGLYCGQTVTYINMQLAFFMGFSEVYLIGMDFDYVIPKEHKRNGNNIVSTTDDPNHFHKDYFGVGKTWRDPKLDRVAMNYHQAKISYESVGRKIYNATAGGKLEIFDRVDYENLLRDPQTRKKRTHWIPPLLDNRREEIVPDFPRIGTSSSEMHYMALRLTSMLLLDPVKNLQRIETDGDLSHQVKMLLDLGGDATEHFIKVRDFARTKIKRM